MKKLLYASIVIGVFIGCSKQGVIEPIPKMNIAEYSSTADGIALDLAKKLAANISNPEMKAFLKKEVNAQFDGDFNFLFLNAKNKPIGDAGSTTFINLLYNSGASNGRLAGNDIVAQIENEYPLLQIAIPELVGASPETWDTESYTPLIAVVPTNYTEASGVNHILAFDAEGNEHYVDTKNEPENLVIIINANERLQGYKKTANARFDLPCFDMYATPALITNNWVFYLKDDVSLYRFDDGCKPPGDDDDPPPPAGCDEECDRDCKTGYNYVERARFKDIEALKDFEDWIYAGPELRLLILKGSVDSGGFRIVDKTYSSQRKDWRSCTFWGVCTTNWHTMNLRMLKWPETEMGDRIVMSWVEEDNLFLADYSVTLTETMYFRTGEHVSGTVTYSGDGYLGGKMGDDLVKYCDNTDGLGTYYANDNFQWYVNQ
ncbi:MAG: hypothetical protein L3J06_09620 [Cyclobacteriaceae bacterium]|nr:hypothetical protein [Cyclobacteriaceae bacterium]